MPSLSGLFGSGSIGEQLFVWGLLNEVVGALTQPFVQAMQELAWDVEANVPLQPGDAAQIVARGLQEASWGTGEAQRSGMNGARFADLVAAAEQAADLGSVVAAFQRGLIPLDGGDITTPSLTAGLKRAGIADEWLSVIQQLAVQIPTGAEVMNAWLEGQITEDEARARWLAAGQDPTWFQTAYDANGEAPTPSQALELLNRGIIPLDGTGPDAVSYQQAFLEGPWRNKWLDAFVALRYYYPPPRTVTAMFHDGQLTRDQAAHYLTVQGLDADLVTAYLADKKATTATAEKALSRSDILALYTDRLLTRPQAITHLEGLKYSADDANSILEVADLKQATAQLSEGVGHVRTLYQAGKLTEPQAIKSLETLEVPSAQASQIVATWAVTASTKVKLLTPAQIVDAWYYQLIPLAEATDALISEGYDAHDAWVVLSVKNKGPIKGYPDPG